MRSASDQRREQLKWLTGGAAALLAGLAISLLATGSGSPAGQAALIISRLAIVAFPVSMGVAILKYRRRRVQQVVDRRFNRARYDADQTIAAFAARLKDTADLDSVQDDLATVVHLAL